MSDNNRYSGEVYIDQDTDNLFAAFMQNILNVYSGSGKNFDADKLDGRHWDHDAQGEGDVEGIKQYIDNKCDAILNLDTTSFLTQIWLNGIRGQTPEDEEDKSIVKFNITDENINVSPNQLQPSNISTIHDALDFLYTKSENINQVTNQKVDQTDFDTLDSDVKALDFDLNTRVTTLENNTSTLDNHLQTDDQNQTKTYLNADRIGGYNIIPVTKAKYDELAAVTDTEDTKYKYFHCPKNIFIQSDNVANDNTIDTKCHYRLEEGYKFQVDNNGMLQYQHPWSNTWNDITDVSNILGLKQQNTESSSLVQIVSTLVTNFIQENIKQGKFNEYIQSQIKEQMYTEYINDIRYQGEPLQKKSDNDNHYYINLDSVVQDVIISTNNNFTNTVESMYDNIGAQVQRTINPTVSQLTNNISLNANKIDQLQAQVQQLSTNMNNINQTIQEKVTQTCQQKISSLVSAETNSLFDYISRINSYGSPINQDSHWKNIPMSWKIDDNKISSLDYNESLQLAILHLYTKHTHISGNKGKTVDRYGTAYNPVKIPNNIAPVNRIWARIMPSRYVVLETDGSIKFNFEYEPDNKTRDVEIDIPFFYKPVDAYL